jgi:GDP-4-dehydro-6-deoxy-D-mannose reductase
MRVLITGGGGFLAGHLSTHLSSLNGIELRNLRRADCDLATDRQQLTAVLSGFRPETVFHLAGRISGAESELDHDNRVATVNLLDAVRQECPAARILFGSTTGVYADGGTSAYPLSESDSTKPHGAYAVTKYACEQAARFHAEAGGSIVIARMTNPVGSNMASRLLCGTLAKQIVEIERGMASAVTLRDLKSKRDFISARDCVRALWDLAQFGESGAVYNVASGISTSIENIVDIYFGLARVHPIEVRVVPAEGERSSVREQWISNAKLLALGWRPRETVREAIRGQLEAERAGA